MFSLKNIYNVKGVKHVFYPEIYLWQYIEKEFKFLINSYCYEEIKLPLIEKTFLFTKTLGSNSDIIKKEMFSFKDKKNRNLTLLPEGTTSCLKSLIFGGFLRNLQKQNVWYISPMFRKENPQKGRQRLFYQIGLESLGEENIKIDLEHVFIINKFFKRLGINNLILEVNYIDNTKKSVYKKILESYFLNKNLQNFCKNNLNFNSLSILDKVDKEIFNDIPSSLNYINKKKKIIFVKIIYFLKILNINFIINKFLVRGLNYYDELVYEWTTKLDMKELTLCAGGRYNNLSKNFVDTVHGTGCALGIERIILALNNNIKKKIDIFLFFEQNISLFNIAIIKEFIINEFKNFSIYVDFVKLSFEQRIKKSKKKNINLLLFIDNSQLKKKKIILIINNLYKIIHFTKLSRYIWKKKIKF